MRRSKTFENLIGLGILLVIEIGIKAIGFRDIYPVILIGIVLLWIVGGIFYFRVYRRGIREIGYLLGIILLSLLVSCLANHFFPNSYLFQYYGRFMRMIFFIVPFWPIGFLLKNRGLGNPSILILGIIPFWAELVFPGGFSNTAEGLILLSNSVEQVSVPLPIQISYGGVL